MFAHRKFQISQYHLKQIYSLSAFSSIVFGSEEECRRIDTKLLHKLPSEFLLCDIYIIQRFISILLKSYLNQFKMYFLLLNIFTYIYLHIKKKRKLTINLLRSHTTVILTLGRQIQKGQVYKVIFSCIVISSPDWATCDPVSNNQNQNKILKEANKQKTFKYLKDK